jgi:hypothetical protein
MKTMRTGLRLLIVAVLYSSFVEPSALCGDSDWVSYENRKVGLTFRHPPELWTREAPDYIRAGLDARAVIELVGKTELNPDTMVLRFIIDPFKVRRSSRIRLAQAITSHVSAPDANPPATSQLMDTAH